ncbi:HEAT repeat domain-containing protein [Enterovibrio nigricans]|uniref:HEAT repeat-containing protein n=1 Tax=Enterovibrio nigricans DSM 22720 TaxID=1121868 RepID=A0A1T4VQG6_9GAMM|nr:HEAT repeat domain-containing protein [Enterovibrio nigricans]PKF49474.1 hypothetical protein AT251_18580 [Enterovibrio nigricans]SKA67115.1 hypothetical protein SAMN02745132_04188 [Enterovibrio nigricans DSM 22720]
MKKTLITVSAIMFQASAVYGACNLNTDVEQSKVSELIFGIERSPTEYQSLLKIREVIYNKDYDTKYIECILNANPRFHSRNNDSINLFSIYARNINKNHEKIKIEDEKTVTDILTRATDNYTLVESARALRVFRSESSIRILDDILSSGLADPVKSEAVNSLIYVGNSLAVKILRINVDNDKLSENTKSLIIEGLNFLTR